MAPYLFMMSEISVSDTKGLSSDSTSYTYLAITITGSQYIFRVEPMYRVSLNLNAGQVHAES
jgi:hypothetical protein